MAKVVPSFALGVVDYDECAEGGHGMSQEIVGLAEDAVVSGDGGLVGPRAHHAESIFGLLEEFGPVV